MTERMADFIFHSWLLFFSLWVGFGGETGFSSITFNKMGDREDCLFPHKDFLFSFWNGRSGGGGGGILLPPAFADNDNAASSITLQSCERTIFFRLRRNLFFLISDVFFFFELWVFRPFHISRFSPSSRTATMLLPYHARP